MNKSITLGFRLALQSLKHNRLRSVLTMFGILVGIAMVIIVMSAGNGVKSLILGEVSSFGDNWINIEVKVPSTGKNSTANASAMSSGVTITTLTAEDAEAVEALSSITNTYAVITGQAVVAYGQEKMRPMIYGVTPSYIEIDTSTVEEGRFFTEEENKSASQVVVLGSEAKEVLFGNNDAIGKNVRIDGKGYSVVGVMTERGATGFFNMDSMIYLPLATTQKKIMGINHVLAIIAQTDGTGNPENTAEEIRWLIRERHDISDPEKDDFAVTTMEEALEIVDTVVFGLTMLLIVLSAISLLVGGVGIMNVMYVSVAERTFEIGLRKAVGARKEDILKQFLSEAVFLTVFGGVAGVLIGILFSYLVAVGAQYGGLDWEFHISLASILISTVFSLTVGIIFGVYPARRAAELDPIEALRQE